MNYITVKEAAEKWGVSTRRVQILCSKGRINGAMHFGKSIMIPEDSVYPVGEREAQTRDKDQPLPRKTPFLYMSDLYSVPGSGDSVAESLAYNREAQVLFEAEVAYSRGNIDKVYESANYLLKKHSGFYAVISAGMLLAMCAVWQGDLNMWRMAKVHISEAPAKDDFDRDIMQLAISAVDIMVYNVTSFPEWFKIGCFEPLNKDATPAATVYYAKYLYATAYSVATGALKIEGIQGLSLMSIIPLTVEPLISWAQSSKTVITEIYLRMTCAAVYHNSGDDARAISHIDRSIALALPDKLYGLLAEYCRALDSLLEQRLVLVDKEAWAEVNALYKAYNKGWSALSGAVRGRQIITTLSAREREVAKLAAFGMSNAEIAEKLGMSLAGVKQAIRITSEKSGMERKSFAAIL